MVSLFLPHLLILVRRRRRRSRAFASDKETLDRRAGSLIASTLSIYQYLISRTSSRGKKFVPQTIDVDNVQIHVTLIQNAHSDNRIAIKTGEIPQTAATVVQFDKEDISKSISTLYGCIEDHKFEQQLNCVESSDATDYVEDGSKSTSVPSVSFAMES
ncbi:uncharacterized protein LOC122086010 [Macadamia integrifolia]|uniref:uncharacterized protein LOC122086010 n=1 Tax=Macadamia integrifolia TaxID=60698 RepID=UPI001C4F09D5|nr:uncharacterized protein LOC122086010 [Macadamia integrifolia]